MPEFGYNIGQMAIQLHQGVEGVKAKEISKKLFEIEELTEKLEIIKDLLAALNRDRDVNKAINWEGNPEMMGLVDSVRKVSPNTIDPGKYSWQPEEIDRIIESINTEATTLSSKINPKTMLLTQSFQERNEITKIVADMIKEIRDLCQNLVRHQETR